MRDAHGDALDLRALEVRGRGRRLGRDGIDRRLFVKFTVPVLSSEAIRLLGLVRLREQGLAAISPSASVSCRAPERTGGPIAGGDRMRSGWPSARALLVSVLVSAILLMFPGTQALAAYAAGPPDPPPSSQVQLLSGDTPVGLQAYGPSTTQIAGANRIATAVAASRFGWSSAKAVVIATSRQFPDALVGGPLAFLLDGPILLTEPGALPTAVRDEIRRLGATSAVVLGGTAVVSAQVERDLMALGMQRSAVVRIGGRDRYDTSRLVAEYMGDADRVALAVGTNFPDALSVSAMAGRIKMPILLTATKSLPAATASAIAKVTPTETLVIGGTAVISDAVTRQVPDPTRIAGANRFETAKLVGEYATRFGLGYGKTFVATGLNFPDALAVGPLVAKVGGTLVLATPTTLPPASEDFFLDHCSSIETIHYVGGTAAVGTLVRTAIGTAAQTLISDATVVADAATMSALETITPAGDMVFTAPATAQLAAMSPATTRIIFIGEGGYSGSPDGFMREVSGKSSTALPGKVVLYTKAVALEDAIAKGSIDYSEPVEDLSIVHASIDAVSGQLVPEASVSAQLQVGFSASASLDYDLGMEYGLYSGAVTTSGQLTLRGGVFLNVSIRWFSIKSFNCGVYGEETAEVGIEVWAQISKRMEATLAEIPLGTVPFSIGPVPVKIDFDAEIYVGFEAYGKVALTTGFEQGASVEYGLAYKKGSGWRRIQERKLTWEYSPPVVYGEFGASAFAGVKINCKFYGVFGPYVTAEGGLYFNAAFPVWQASSSEAAMGAQPAPEPIAGSGEVGQAAEPTEVSWELGVYADLKAGIEVKFWIFKIGWEFVIRLAAEALDSYEAEPVPPGTQPILYSVTSLDPTTVRLDFAVYESPPGNEQEIAAFDPGKITIWDGEGDTASALPITGCVVDPTDDSRLLLTTAEQTLKRYWVKCETGTVTDDAARGSDFAHRPFIATHYAKVTPLTQGLYWPRPTIGLDGIDGRALWMTWPGGPDFDTSPNVMVRDLSAGVTNQLTNTARYEGGNAPVSIADGTIVFEVWPNPNVPDGVYAVSATSGVDPVLVEEYATSPQVSGDWVCYLLQVSGGSAPELVAERLSTGEQSVVMWDFNSDPDIGDRYELSAGRVMLEHTKYGDGAMLEVLDLANPGGPTLVYMPFGGWADIGQTRLEGDIIAWVEGGTRVMLTDLGEASPAAVTLEAPALVWTGLDVWGDNVVCRTEGPGGAELWVGDLGLDPESWVRVIMPVGWSLDSNQPLTLYGGQLASVVRDADERQWIGLVAP